ncbi:phage tail family protein [Listeria monocytogenes]|nr:phage tail family protein [Listeria monocytogenes]
MSELYFQFDKNDELISLSSQFSGIYVEEFSRDAPQQKLQASTIEGTDGEIPQTITYDPFKVYVKLDIRAVDHLDYHLLYRELNAFLHRRKTYRIASDQLPGLFFSVYPQPQSVSRESETIALVTFEFTAYKGYAESRGSTLDPLTFDSELWGVGDGILMDSDMQYVFNTNKFSIYNASDDVISPIYRHEIDIALTCAGSPQITNKTTNDIFKCTSTLVKKDVLLISGVYPFINGKHAGKNSNHGILTLNPGWNEFEVKGVSDLTIAFGFKFIYR